MRIVTWNLQGSSHSTENKWNEGLRPLIEQTGADAICVQECGAVPETAAPQGRNNAGLELYTWGGTKTRPGVWILFYPWDVNGNRCNLAVISRIPPQNPLVLYPAGLAHRPVIGAQYNNVFVFSIHGISPGGPDVQGLLNAVVAQGLASWVVAGDFNREPGTIPPGAWIVCPPAGWTHPATAPASALDYAVVSANYGRQVQGQVLGLQMSDHLPVGFVF